MNVGAQLAVTTVMERTVMKNVEENPKEKACIGIVNAYTNAQNVDRLMENIDQYKGKIVEMKEVPRKEEKVGRESKIKYEATLSKFERISQRHQILEAERDNSKSSNEALHKEKGSLESKVAELELQKTTVEEKAKQYQTQVAALDAQKASLKVLFKVEIEQRTDIEPMTKHSLLLKSKIY